MIRFVNILAVASVIASAVYAYSIKYESIVHAEQLARVRAEIATERDAIAVLRAEWALLNRPDRVQALADAHLDSIVPVDPRRFTRFSDLPDRPERSDDIGRKLEALGLAAPTATPGAARAGGATPSTTGSLR
ncbi:MAG: hypothetical protein EA385_02955 [Salinarimonadaceae bacterium]|nr:MAG: hypothetical protein EA385_02955 [Salinarimonadaceae bacterium]